jgi:hypothetical protein
VATTTRSGRFAARARSWTLSIMVLPWITERGFPGRRVDAKRAGMMATMANFSRGPRVTRNATRSRAPKEADVEEPAVDPGGPPP